MTSAHRIVSTAGIMLTAAVWLGSARPALADSFVLITGVGANHGCIPGGSPTLPACPNNDGDEDADFQRAGPNNGAGLVTATNADDGFDDPYFTYSAAADAEFGRLHVQASGSYDFTELSDPSVRLALAFASATDYLMISAPGLTGEGILDISFLLTGTLDKTGTGGAGVLVAVTAGPDPEAFTPNNEGQFFEYLDLTLPSGPVTVPVRFVWGQPFYLSMIMVVGAGTPITTFIDPMTADASFIPVAGTGSGTADFFNTLTLVGLVPKDENNNPVLNANFSSELGSGTQYSTTGVVPEPGSLLLLGSGLAVGIQRWRRRRTADAR